MVDIYKLVKPQEGDIIIAEIDITEESGLDIQDAANIHKQIVKQFPFNTVISVPSFCSIDLYTQDEAIAYFENILNKLKSGKI